MNNILPIAPLFIDSLLEVYASRVPVAIAEFWRSARRGEFPFQSLADLEQAKVAVADNVHAVQDHNLKAISCKFIDAAYSRFRANLIVNELQNGQV